MRRETRTTKAHAASSDDWLQGVTLAGYAAINAAASAFVLPVVEIDGKPIGDGRPGPVAKEFRRLYVEEAGKG